MGGIGAVRSLRWPLLGAWLVLSLALLELQVLGLARVIYLPLTASSGWLGEVSVAHWLFPGSFGLAGAALGGRQRTVFPVGSFVVGGVVCGGVLDHTLDLWTFLYDSEVAAVWILGTASLSGALAVAGAPDWSWPRATLWAVVAGVIGWLISPAELEDLHQAAVVLCHALLPLVTPFVLRR